MKEAEIKFQKKNQKSKFGKCYCLRCSPLVGGKTFCFSLIFSYGNLLNAHTHKQISQNASVSLTDFQEAALIMWSRCILCTDWRLCRDFVANLYKHTHTYTHPPAVHRATCISAPNILILLLFMERLV